MEASRTTPGMIGVIAALDAIAVEVTAVLEAAEIPALLPKGASIGRWLYDSVGERAYDDVDLLVRQSHLAQAERTLRREAFRFVHDDDHGQVWQRGPVNIDLHRRLTGAKAPPGRVAAGALQFFVRAGSSRNRHSSLRLSETMSIRSAVPFLTCLLAALALCAAPAWAAKPATTADVAIAKPPLPPIEKLQLEPPSLTLENALDARLVIVWGLTKDGQKFDLTDDSTLKAESNNIAIGADRYINPVAAGLGSVTVSAAGKTASLSVKVKGADTPPISFARDVEPILAKTGCNSGTCHGSKEGKNGFKDWRQAISDVSASGRYLVGQGIADPQRLAIVGWSYGGYAALQSAAVDPSLYKAAVAIAPVTDLSLLKAESEHFTNYELVKDFVGSGPEVIEGSPLRQVSRIKIPVLLFHGDMDRNVDIEQSAKMAAALRSAGDSVDFVRFKGLDHQLDDSNARIQMLSEIGEFLDSAIGH